MIFQPDIRRANARCGGWRNKSHMQQCEEKEEAHKMLQGACSGLTASPFSLRDQHNTTAELSFALRTSPPRVALRGTEAVQTPNKKAENKELWERDNPLFGDINLN